MLFFNYMAAITMPDIPHARRSFFTTYIGVRLPLKLLNPLSKEAVHNRNTYFCAYYDNAERLIAIQKMVYGEVELTHRYDYHPDGTLLGRRSPRPVIPRVSCCSSRRVERMDDCRICDSL